MKKRKTFLLALIVSIALFVLPEIVQTPWAGYVGLMGFLSTAITIIVWLVSWLYHSNRHGWVIPGLLSLLLSYLWFVFSEPLLLAAFHSLQNYGTSAFLGDVQIRSVQMLLPSIILTFVVVPFTIFLKRSKAKTS